MRADAVARPELTNGLFFVAYLIWLSRQAKWRANGDDNSNCRRGGVISVAISSRHSDTYLCKQCKFWLKLDVSRPLVPTLTSRDTRDRHLARRHPDAQALRREGARAKRHACRRARGRRRASLLLLVQTKPKATYRAVLPRAAATPRPLSLRQNTNLFGVLAAS